LSIVQKTAPQCLQDKQIYVFDVTGLISNTIFRGQLEGRVKSILDYVKNNLNVILFIDEIHLIVGAGNSIGGMDLSNMMKAALSRGEARVIGATTLDEYKQVHRQRFSARTPVQPVKSRSPRTPTPLRSCTDPFPPTRSTTGQNTARRPCSRHCSFPNATSQIAGCPTKHRRAG